VSSAFVSIAGFRLLVDSNSLERLFGVEADLVVVVEGTPQGVDGSL